MMRILIKHEDAEKGEMLFDQMVNVATNLTSAYPWLSFEIVEED